MLYQIGKRSLTVLDLYASNTRCLQRGITSENKIQNREQSVFNYLTRKKTVLRYNTNLVLSRISVGEDVDKILTMEAEHHNLLQRFVH